MWYTIELVCILHAMTLCCFECHDFSIFFPSLCINLPTIMVLKKILLLGSHFKKQKLCQSISYCHFGQDECQILSLTCRLSSNVSSLSLSLSLLGLNRSNVLLIHTFTCHPPQQVASAMHFFVL